ncbi:hypothetical protein U9M48_035766 [Paspalum notatum var. saurae]|uniref:Integrase catalytic domain-containing protein n=1 Tax=Paspalum notatum var. saurae TaxID=547442 RepID=A0AAQ3UFS7_PASNO
MSTPSTTIDDLAKKMEQIATDLRQTIQQQGDQIKRLSGVVTRLDPAAMGKAAAGDDLDAQSKVESSDVAAAVAAANKAAAAAAEAAAAAASMAAATKRDSSVSPLGALKLLQRMASVDEYCEQFMTLACRDAELSKKQQVQLFIAGLCNPLQIDVSLRSPATLNEAITLARAYEQRLLLPAAPPACSGGCPSYRQQFVSAPAGSSAAGAASSNTVESSTATASAMPNSALGRRRLNQSEMAQRRAVGLCYNCDEKFVYGHKCKKLFILEVAPDDDEEPEHEEQEEQQQDLTISLHALTSIRSTTYQTMQIWVFIGGARLTALLDSGSTHNFINDEVASRLQLPLPCRSKLRVIVGNGDQVACSGMYPGIDATIGCERFVLDCYAMPVGGFDLVLGVNFLGTLGPILWDFGEQTLCFQRADRRILWAGLDRPPKATLQSITAAGDNLLDSLLHQFAAVFAEPNCLPPHCAISHRIRLQPGTAAVAVRPYRYAHIQKDELERQCTDMMHQGVIRPSSSAFSSPALLVRKHDGSWCMCIDYRALNAKTIKDKYPIPVVEELLDELRGAKFFTKLDLRSGYHQVRMHEADIHKTAFRTHQGLFEFLVMPFGLTNSPTTFQALMNTVLRRFLRRFVLVFFDDILIYIPSVAYLGHVISAIGVAMDSDKVQAVPSWPVPKNVRAVRGFLGLAGYYRRFINNYGVIATPLTLLLRKEGLHWTPEAEAAFQELQQALTKAPVLQLPDFSLPFIVECDASGSGFGAVLHQGQGAVAFFSKPIAARHAKLAAYERELIGLVLAVRLWRPYLWGREFMVKTDHRSLKFLLDQRLATIPQHQWASKLIGFDFSVEYKPGHANVVADALSRRDSDELAQCAAIFGPRFSLFDDLRAELDVTDDAHGMGHEGIQKTLHRVRAIFHIPGDRSRVQDHVRACATCQQNKIDQLRPACLLQPLEVPSAVWADIAMDFIEGLPRVHGKTVILTVVDRFSKFAHFIPLSHPYTATTVAKAFFAEIVRLHGIPASIVSDRDTVFTSAFWKELLKLSGVSLNMSTAFHPQSDGQSEVTNKIIAMYLRCLTGDRPRQWLQWLPWAEFCYNSSFQASLGTSPFRVVYGRDLPTVRPFQPDSATLPAVEQQLVDRDEFLAEIRDRLEQAQQYHKAQYDRRHRDVMFSPGQWVWLRLIHRPAASLDVRGRSKLGPRFYGPFKILERIGQVAYRLELLATARIHDVFHVGLLMPYRGPEPTQQSSLPPIHHGRACPVPHQVLRGRLARGQPKVLVQWQGLSAADASWMPLTEFQRLYPSFQLEDELLVQAGRDVMWGKQYGPRPPTSHDYPLRSNPSTNQPPSHLGSNFTGSEFFDFCEQRSINIKYVSVAHPRANGQVERANGMILDALKKKIFDKNEKLAGKWICELPYVVWSLRTHPSKALAGNTPFFMVYGLEAVLLADLQFGAPRLVFKDIAEAEATRIEEIDLLEEERLNSVIQSARYQQILRRYHDRNMRPHSFSIGELVLCRVLKTAGQHKLSPPWEGPYIVTEVTHPGSYRLSQMDGTLIGNSWNIEHLHKFYA